MIDLTAHQPRVSDERIAGASGALRRYRVMAFATGVVLLAGCLALIGKAAGVSHLEPGTGLLWVLHGYLYLVYVIMTVLLGLKLRWPPARYVLVMLAGTIPTMSFVAEHVVTKAARAASSVPVS